MAKLRLELRGTAKGNLPSQITLETEGRITGTSHWAKLPLAGEKYKAFGAITAWRVTLWSGDQMIGEQKSFLLVARRPLSSWPHDGGLILPAAFAILPAT